MVLSPGFAEDLAFFVQLSRDVVAQVSESLLELVLESVEDVVDVVHRLHRLLLVLLNLTVSGVQQSVKHHPH